MKRPDGLKPSDDVVIRWVRPEDEWPTFTVRYVADDGVLLQGRNHVQGRIVSRHDGTHSWAVWGEIRSMEVVK